VSFTFEIIFAENDPYFFLLFQKGHQAPRHIVLKNLLPKLNNEGVRAFSKLLGNGLIHI